MPEELKRLFKKLFDLSDKAKYKDQDINTYLEDLWDKAQAKEKVQEANKDLVSQREEWKVKEREYKQNVESLTSLKTQLESEKQKLLSSQLTEEQKAALHKGLTPEMEAVMNTLKKTVEEQGSQMKSLQDSLEKTSKDRELARLSAAKEAMNGQLTQALMQQKIKDPAQITAALSLISAQNMAQIEKNEDGTTKHIFTYTENGKPYSFNGADDLAKYIAENHQYLVSASGKTGSNNNYNPTGEPANNPNPQSLQEAMANATRQFEQYMNKT